MRNENVFCAHCVVFESPHANCVSRRLRSPIERHRGAHQRTGSNLGPTGSNIEATFSTASLCAFPTNAERANAKRRDFKKRERATQFYEYDPTTRKIPAGRIYFDFATLMRQSASSGMLSRSTRTKSERPTPDNRQIRFKKLRKQRRNCCV